MWGGRNWEYHRRQFFMTEVRHILCGEDKYILWLPRGGIDKAAQAKIFPHNANSLLSCGDKAENL